MPIPQATSSFPVYMANGAAQVTGDEQENEQPTPINAKVDAKLMSETDSTAHQCSPVLQILH